MRSEGIDKINGNYKKEKKCRKTVHKFVLGIDKSIASTNELLYGAILQLYGTTSMI